MQERHLNRKQYHLEQGLTTKKYVIPYIQEVLPINDNLRVLEIGCGEGGNLSPFIEMGCEVVGVDINEGQIKNAKTFIDEHGSNAKVSFLNENIYDLDVDAIGLFDLVMLRDVIEHIPDQNKFLQHLKSFLKPKAVIFFGFPPWCMPFGGHQQVCRSSFLSKLPYFHLLPNSLYVLLLKSFGESQGTIDSLLEIKETRISINRFNRIVSSNGYQFRKKTMYFINPNYEIKFGLKPRKQNKIIESIPFFRDFATTCYYSLIEIKGS